jgi:hypothetical protein
MRIASAGAYHVPVPEVMSFAVRSKAAVRLSSSNPGPSPLNLGMEVI